MIKITPEQVAQWIIKNFPTYKVRKNGDEYLIPNPFYHNEKLKMGVSCSRAVVHDWRSDDWAAGGKPTFLRLVQLYKKCSFADAVKEVTGQKISGIAALNLHKKEEIVEEIVQASIALPVGSSPILQSKQPRVAHAIRAWLKSRGVNDEKIEQYNIHHLVDKVIWPYYEWESLVYWQSRSYVDKIFLFPPESAGVSKGMFLYNFDNVEMSDYVIVVEAIFGVMTIEKNCVATGGAMMTQQQVNKLRALNPTRGVILAPDNDTAGITSLFHNYKLINPYFPVFYSLPPRIMMGNGEYTKDWNDCINVGLSSAQILDRLDKSVVLLTPSELTSLAKFL